MLISTKFVSSEIVVLFLLFLGISRTQGACPFSHNLDNDESIPHDGAHRNLRDLSTTLDSNDPQVSIFFSNNTENPSNEQTISKTLGTKNVILGIKEDIIALANRFSNAADRGHFFGGIVRIAAHDFMDYDQTDMNEPGGSDGCLDFNDHINAGLPDLWCDNADACPFKYLYDTYYSRFMSKADFWIASAAKVIEITSPPNNPLIIPLRWGRVDNDSCPSSSSRLPETDGCSEIQTCFVDRMGLSWTDATALMGGHTLGRGNAKFSGHDGTWVNTDEESTKFDKRFYTELVNRSWRPTNVPAGIDWVWRGGRNRNVMMLNTDICLYFDIPDGNQQNCCTRESNRDCGGLPQCPSATSVRPDTVAAVNSFRSGARNDNENFFYAFSKAWVAATENGHTNLTEDLDACGVSPSPCDQVGASRQQFSKEQNTSSHSWTQRVNVSSNILFICAIVISSFF